MNMQVMTIIDKDSLADFCRRWQIRELALFGSSVRDDFSQDSDIDLLVTFADDVRYTFGHLATMQTELAQMFGRPVDLISRHAVERSANYIRRKSILDAAEVIYEGNGNGL